MPKGLCSIDRLGGADDCDLCCEYCKAKEDCRECAINKCFNKLGEYEDLEEQGKLVKLPCAVGDEVYRINRGAEVPIIPMKVIAIGILSLKTGDLIVQITCRDGRDGGTTHYLSWEFGESVFFSEEEAELKEPCTSVRL